MTYATDRARADRVMSDVQILLRTECGWITEIATEQLDQQNATDLVTSTGLHIAVRCRSYKFFERYSGEFTIRSHRINGTKTELAKITDGFGDVLHYGFLENVHHRYFRHIDLAALRMMLKSVNLDEVSEEIPNHDHSTLFRAFKLKTFPPHFRIIMKEGEPLDHNLTLAAVQDELRSWRGDPVYRQKLWRRLDALVRPA